MGGSGGKEGGSSSLDRFDYKLAWPSQSHLKIQFLLLAIINAIVSTVCLLLIVGILRYRKVRQNAFNLYILFIAIPDFIVSFFCFLTCAMSAPEGRFYSEWMCSFQAFYLLFGFTANCWMNAVVVYEVHRLLRLSKRMARYIPPTRTTALMQVVAVYLYAAFWGLTSVWDIPRWPQKTQLLYGFNCFPNDYDRQGSTAFYFFVFLPLFMGIPLVYAFFVMCDIWRRKLLPPTGKRRELALYFSRVILVYFGMWAPFLIVCTIGNFVNITSWVYWVGAAWAHIQGLVSSIVASTRPQIKDALIDTYRCVQENERKERKRSTEYTSSSRFSWMRAVNDHSSDVLRRPGASGNSSSNILPRTHCSRLSEGESLSEQFQSHQIGTMTKVQDTEMDAFGSDQEMLALIYDKFTYDDDHGQLGTSSGLHESDPEDPGPDDDLVSESDIEEVLPVHTSTHVPRHRAQSIIDDGSAQILNETTEKDDFSKEKSCR